MPTSLSTSAGKFLKSNAKFAYGGGVGLAFLAGDIKGILDADNKLKALLKTAKDFILIRVAFIGIFKAVSDVVKGLVRDTGSLDAALKRLTQIQQYARAFQAFTGSLASAKQKIAELHQLSLRGVFKFEDLVEANKSLQVFTRGAYTSVEATKTVGEASIATGNSIQDTARAVGNFYDTLRSGESVKAAADQLRQMGLISTSTADQLTSMSESGASVEATFNELTSALEKTAQGAAGYKEELQSVTEEHAKAAEELKVAFGAPWTDADIQSTRNMSEGMKSITPAVAELSKSFAFLFNSASTLGSALFKIVAGSKAVQKALVIMGEAIMAVAVAAGLFATGAMIPLISLLLKFSLSAAMAAETGLVALGVGLDAATLAATGLQIALSTLLVGSVVLMAAAFVAALVGVVVKAKEEAVQAQKEFQDWTKSLKESTAAILEQAAAVTTLASKYETLGKTLQRMSANQKELKKLRAEERHLNKEIEVARELYGDEPKKLIQQLNINKAKQAELLSQQRILSQSKEEQAARQPLHEQLIKQEADREYFIEQQTKGVEERDREARAGVAVAAKAETDRSAIVAKRMALEQGLRDEEAREKVAPEKQVEHQVKILGLQDQITKLKKEEQDIGLAAPGFSATAKAARAEQLQEAKKAVEAEAEMRGKKFATTEEKQAAERRLKQAQILAGPEAIKAYKADPGVLTRATIQAQKAIRAEAEPPSPEETRQLKVRRFEVETEITRGQARGRGDIKTVQAMEDLSKFSHHAEDLMAAGFGKPEALALAGRQTAADVAEEYASHPPPVAGITAIGGGGELPAVNAQLDIQRRMETLQQKMVDYLAIMSGQQPEQQQQPPVFQ